MHDAAAAQAEAQRLEGELDRLHASPSTAGAPRCVPARHRCNTACQRRGCLVRCAAAWSSWWHPGPHPKPRLFRRRPAAGGRGDDAATLRLRLDKAERAVEKERRAAQVGTC
jgi:hypothetical protein